MKGMLDPVFEEKVIGHAEVRQTFKASGVGTIAGSYVTDGKFQRNSQDNGFLGRCRGLLKIGMYSKDIAEYPIDFTPVDECADAYVRLALNGRDRFALF